MVVAATGDRTRPSIKGFPMEFPAARPGVVAVNAGDRTGRAWVNNPPPVRSFVDGNPVITAPGVEVTSIRFVAGRGWVSGLTRTGTSDAAPIVAGALALVKSKYPDATGNQLIQHLVHHAAGGRCTWDRYYGFGLVSVTKMLAEDPRKWPDINPLLHGPKRALRDFPMSSYGSHPASTRIRPGSTTDPGGAPAAADELSDRPWRVPVAAGAVVAALLGVGLVLRRRTRSGHSGR